MAHPPLAAQTEAASIVGTPRAAPPSEQLSSTCLVCLLDYDADAHYPVRTSPCVHIVCKTCAAEWHRITSKCCVCSGQVVFYKPAKEAARVFGLAVAPDKIDSIENAGDPLLETVLMNDEHEVVMVRPTLEEEQQQEREAREDSYAAAEIDHREEERLYELATSALRRRRRAVTDQLDEASEEMDDPGDAEYSPDVPIPEPVPYFREDRIERERIQRRRHVERKRRRSHFGGDSLQ